MMLSEDMLRLEQAIDHLPAETRELMIAVKLEGRTYQELADETGKTSDAVRMQANRAMNALRDEMVGRDGRPWVETHGDLRRSLCEQRHEPKSHPTLSDPTTPESLDDATCE